MSEARSDRLGAVITDLDGHARGSGFLVAANHVLTCAHVVAEALDAPASGDRPQGHVLVRLPGSSAERRAEVVPGGWLPWRPGSGDLAVLHLVDPTEHRPRPPSRERAEAGAVVEIWHPDPEGPDRRWRAVVLDSPDPGSTAWSRLKFPGPVPGPGVSGAAVWDRDGRGVVGILMANPGHEDRASGWMLPVGEALDLVPLTTVRPKYGEGTRPSRLTLRELGELVDALLAVRLEPMELDLILGHLRPALALGVPRYSAARPQAIALLRTCAQWPDGLRTLVAALRMLKAAGPELETFAALVDKMTSEPLLLPTERTELHRLLTFVPSRVPGENLLERAVELEDSTAPPGGPVALLEFVSEVAARADPPVREALLDWRGGTAERLGPNAVPAQPPAGSPEAPWVLTFLLQKAAWDSARFELSSWLLRGPDDEAVPLRGSSEPMSLDTVRAAVGETLEEVTRLGSHADRLRVEFVLPPDLLELRVEEWPVDGASEGPALGMLHPVVVRVPHVRRDPDWRTRWQELRTRTLGRTWVEGGGRRVLCLSLGGVEGEPSPQASRARLWSEIVAAGVPAALWSRDGAAETDARIEELAADSTLSTLPEKILELRRGESPWAQSIALLYDDPDSDVSDPPHLPLMSP
ncbi:hypothetical protein RKD23_007610 [Streptomyces sp. SAI-170]|uniref:VMAP-C domain-containing protein n=1 Tax=Streptomyces sp. SAI-170 TaxID=3377729 RepID=UPI003C7A2E1D